MPDIFDIAIIGSGPASLTAAIYTTRGAASTVILGGEKWGGQLMLTTEVENYPGFPEGIMGPELMERMKAQAEHHGAVFIPQNVTSVAFDPRPFELIANNQTYKAKAVIIATGAETLWLGVPGEEKLLGRGVSSCAPCDAPFFKDKRVAVVGGGDSAMEEALVLSKYATEVILIHRRDSFKASHAMQEKVKKNPKIKIMWDSVVTEVVGEQKVQAVKVQNVKTSEISDLAVDGVFVAIGHLPSTNLFQGKIDLDEKGYIKVKEHTKTSVEGVFVAGDVHDHHYKQAVTAAGFGCMAGLDAIHHLDNK